MRKYYLLNLIFLCFLCSNFLNAQVQPDEIIRCYTTEVTERRHQENPNLETVEEFEEWMARGVKQLKEIRKTRTVNQETVYRIPIIFHILHRGEPRQDTPEGALIPNNTNISPALIAAQIEQLNFDFRNDPASIYYEAMHSDAADTRIEFCPAIFDPNGNMLEEPGVNRINTTTTPGLQPGTYAPLVAFDTQVKPSTIWDPERYCNFWSADLAGGAILGYAQFPETAQGGMDDDPQSADTDGVVCLYNTIGGENAEAPNSPFHLGRTGTHEVGHWLGLRHIWGDTDCGGDDFVYDTPNAEDSNGGCPEEKPNTCDDSANPHFNGEDPADQMENYMDYSNDVCFTMFTNGQSDRMRIVMGAANDNGPNGDPIPGSPRRVNLHLNNLNPALTVCDMSGPMILFSNSTSSFSEGTDCPEQTIQIPVSIFAPPTGGDATVTVNVTGGTADALDFDIPNNELTFVAGSDVTQILDIIVYQDGAEEMAETIELSLSLEANGSDAELGGHNTTQIITINNDDLPLSTAKSATDVVLFEEDFENGVNGWTANNGLVMNWYVGTPSNGGPTGATAFTSTSNLIATYPTTPSDESQFDSPVIDIAGYTDLSVDFNYICNGESGFDFGSMLYAVDDGDWTPFGPNLVGTAAFSFKSVPLPVDVNGASTLQIAFKWEQDIFNTDTDYDPPLIFDNVVVKGNIEDEADIAVDAGKQKEIAVRTDEAVHFYDSDKNIIATLQMPSGDLGCTHVEILTSGNGANFSTDALGTGSQAASKSFLVTADDPMATYTIDFYYTEAEINDWIAGFGGVDAPTIDDFRLFKTSAASVDGITSENTIVDMNTSRTDYIVDGVNGYRFSASFTGFSVFGGGNVSGGALPVSWLSFSGKEKNRQTHLEWSTGSESNAEGFEVEWSVDNKTWETVGEVKANNQASSYGFVHPKPAVGYNFYRIQQIDIDGKTSYSNMIVITLEKEAVFELAVQPNPATDKINVEISNSSENFVQLTITSLNGQVIKNERIQVTENRQVQLDISNLPQGIYLLRANNNIDQFVQKLVVY